MSSRPAKARETSLKILIPLSFKEKKNTPKQIHEPENPNYSCLSAGFKIAKGSKAHLMSSAILVYNKIVEL